MEELKEIGKEFKTVWKQANEQAKKEYGYSLNKLLTWVGVSAVVQVAALKNAKRGRWLPAIFYAVLWHGYTSNANATLLFKQAELRDKRVEQVDNFFMNTGPR